MRGRSKANFAIAVIFCIALFLPLIGQVSPSTILGVQVNEMRRLSDYPSFSLDQISKFPGQFESYFNDHFGFRNALIKLDSRFKKKFFNSSSSPKVLIGKDDWLYSTENNMLDDYRGVGSFSFAELEQWKRVLEQRQDWLASQGIEYLFVVAPNKVSIYPEHLPASIKKVSDETPLDQLVTYLSQHSKVNILDLRNALLRQKSAGALYHRTDTHWTPKGAFFAYREIIERLSKLFPQVNPVNINDLNTDTEIHMSGDLASMLGLQDSYGEEIPVYSLLAPAARRTDEVGAIGFSREPFIMETPDKQLPRALMFRDSFATALVPYLSENFSYIQYYWNRWDKNTPISEIILETKPDIVIEESVERFIRYMDLVSNDFDKRGIADYSRTKRKIVNGYYTKNDFLPTNQVEIETKESMLFANSTGTDPHFFFPESFSDEENLSLFTEFTSPADSVFQIYYLTTGSSAYSESNSFSVVTRKGNNKISLPLSRLHIMGRIRIDPGTVPGEYVFKRLEIKSTTQKTEKI